MLINKISENRTIDKNLLPPQSGPVMKKSDFFGKNLADGVSASECPYSTGAQCQLGCARHFEFGLCIPCLYQGGYDCISVGNSHGGHGSFVTL